MNSAGSTVSLSSLYRGSSNFNPSSLKDLRGKVVRAGGMATLLVHPNYSISYFKGKQVWFNGQKGEKVGYAEYFRHTLKLMRFTSCLRQPLFLLVDSTASHPFGVLASYGKNTDRVLVLTDEGDPTPRFKDAPNGDHKRWRSFGAILHDLEISVVSVIGEHAFREGRETVGCVYETAKRLDEAGLEPIIIKELIFPDIDL